MFFSDRPEEKSLPKCLYTPLVIFLDHISSYKCDRLSLEKKTGDVGLYVSFYKGIISRENGFQCVVYMHLPSVASDS